MIPTQSHKCTDYSTHSVTYTNIPTMVPTQSPTRRTSYRSHSVSPRVYRLGVLSCLLYKVAALRISHFPIQYNGSEAFSSSCTVYQPCSGLGPCSLSYLIDLPNLTPIELWWPESEAYCLFRSSADFKNARSSISLPLLFMACYLDTETPLSLQLIFHSSASRFT